MVLATGETTILADPDAQDGEPMVPSIEAAQFSY